MRPPKQFLTAEWRWLAMLNYEIDPALLRPFVPQGTELDSWNGRTFASMVGFLFLNTRVCRVPIPFHRNFEEVNLRFYVRRKAEDGWRRGVVFVKEIVPRFAIAAVARFAYNERYVSLPMRHVVENHGSGVSAAYQWRYRNCWHSLSVVADGEPQPIAVDSQEEFITEHFWGYAAQRDGSAVEYRVEHPRWRVWKAREATFKCDVSALYGQPFVEGLKAEPGSAFLAEGSPVTVYQGLRV
ncbi:MAG TPA: DUF2071 domain-containing protein [Verrucomicrobiae bacterium]|nr:DUF2071 domain-containing protein [Verrucomicrobiae bacterium]